MQASEQHSLGRCAILRYAPPSGVLRSVELNEHHLHYIDTGWTKKVDEFMVTVILRASAAPGHCKGVNTNSSFEREGGSGRQ